MNPKVTIVTPSFNQAEFLELTIQSVLQQTYKNIEYIVMDGGSADGSVDVLQRYADRLAYWETAKDNGAAHAINKGWRKASGEILSYLNSDDLLFPDSVRTIVEAFGANAEADVIYGDAVFIDASGKEIGIRKSEEFVPAKIFTTWEDPIAQPSCFFKMKLLEEIGGLDESYEFCLDFEYWLRLFGKARFLYIPKTLSAARLHPASKTSTLEAVQARDLLRLGEKLIRAKVPALAGVSETDAQRGLSLTAALHFRNAGLKTEALQTFWNYCRRTYPLPLAIGRAAKFAAGLFLKDPLKRMATADVVSRQSSLLQQR